MKLFTLISICMMALLASHAQDLVVKKATVAPVIDAEMDAIWEGAEIQDEFNVVGEDNREDMYDLEPSFRVMWDDFYLYFWVDVIDEYLNVDETYDDLTNFESGSWGWADDVVEIYIDGDNSKSANWVDELDGSQLWWLPDWPGILFFQDVRLNMDTTNILYAKKIWEEDISGWSLEVAIPLADAGIPATADYEFGFEFDLGDDDGNPFSYRPDGPGGRETKLKWYGTVDVTEPINWGTAMLSSEEIVVSAVEDENRPVISSFQLSQNYPNPFNPVTMINYQLSMTNEVALNIYNLFGQKVATLVNETKNAGRYSVSFNASTLPSGIYLYRLVAGNKVVTKKMTVIK
jgi:hypothetical protein